MIPKIGDSLDPIQKAIGYTLTVVQENGIPISVFFTANEETGNVTVSMVRKTENPGWPTAIFPVDDHFEEIRVMPIGTEFAKIPAILQAYFTKIRNLTGIEIPPPIITGDKEDSYTLLLHFRLPTH